MPNSRHFLIPGLGLSVSPSPLVDKDRTKNVIGEKTLKQLEDAKRRQKMSESERKREVKLSGVWVVLLIFARFSDFSLCVLFFSLHDSLPLPYFRISAQGYLERMTVVKVNT